MTSIQWFPGHMRETEQFLKNAISSVDLVMEILDARLPLSSTNPILDKLCKNVLRVKILNKKDLADPEATSQWLSFFKNAHGSNAFAVNGTMSSDAWKAVHLCLEKIKKKKFRRIRIMVAGIPNTGKSTIINSLAGKKIAKTGNVPAITRQQQRTTLKNKVDIYDTPGILWPILDDQDGAYRLAASGAISDTVIDYNEVALFAATFLLRHYPAFLAERYSITDTLPQNGLELIEIIGASRGCLKKGGIINYQKASETLIRELRSGKIGNITLERPEAIDTP